MPAVRGGANARRAVNVHPDVPLRCQNGLSGVDAHADRYVQPSLRFFGGGERVRGAGEGDEEGVSLGVHLDSAIRSERVAEDAPVLGERRVKIIGS